MCALCGAFGATEHWSDATSANRLTPTAERRARASTANTVLGLFGLTLSEWSGRFTLTSRTGKTAVIDNFGTLWPEAERLAGRRCDPLDPEVIAAIGRVRREA